MYWLWESRDDNTQYRCSDLWMLNTCTQIHAKKPDTTGTKWYFKYYRQTMQLNFTAIKPNHDNFFTSQKKIYLCLWQIYCRRFGFSLQRQYPGFCIVLSCVNYWLGFVDYVTATQVLEDPFMHDNWYYKSA